MRIGKLEIGRRRDCRNEFKFFYCPMLEIHRKQLYWFFWWFGYRWYICLRKKKRQVSR